MAFVTLKIVEPVNNLPVEGFDSVEFRGEVVDMPVEAQGADLYYRWYSSLYKPDWRDPENPDHYSIERNQQSSPDEAFTWLPSIGSHAITFAVSDRKTEALDDFKAVEHGGVTGGAAEDVGQCLVHVFRAVPLEPRGGFNHISRADLRLIAEAPSFWGKLKRDSEEYELNMDYHDYNRLQYRWELIPRGAGDTHEYLPGPERLSFGRYSSVNNDIVPTTVEDPNPDDVFVVSFRPYNVSELSGDYTLRLHVEDNQAAGIGRHTADVEITVVVA